MGEVWTCNQTTGSPEVVCYQGHVVYTFAVVPEPSSAVLFPKMTWKGNVLFNQVKYVITWKTYLKVDIYFWKLHNCTVACQISLIMFFTIFVTKGKSRKNILLYKIQCSATFKLYLSPFKSLGKYQPEILDREESSSPFIFPIYGTTTPSYQTVGLESQK